jgi:hypothetical protein
MTGIRGRVKGWRGMALNADAVGFLLLPGLLIYGALVNPISGEGGLPCLWRLATGLTCPGCGLSRAIAFLVRGDAQAALGANKLVVPLVLIAAVAHARNVRLMVASVGGWNG